MYTSSLFKLRAKDATIDTFMAFFFTFSYFFFLFALSDMIYPRVNLQYLLSSCILTLKGRFIKIVLA
jgi:hypothetical protein